MNEKTVEQLAEEPKSAIEIALNDYAWLIGFHAAHDGNNLSSERLQKLAGAESELSRLSAENVTLKAHVKEKVKHATETVCAMLFKKAKTEEEKQAVKTVYIEWEDYFTDLLNNELDLEEYPLHNLFNPTTPNTGNAR